MPGVDERQERTLDRIARGWHRAGFEDARNGSPMRTFEPGHFTIRDFSIDYREGYEEGSQ